MAATKVVRDMSMRECRAGLKWRTVRMMIWMMRVSEAKVPAKMKGLLVVRGVDAQVQVEGGRRGMNEMVGLHCWYVL